MTTSFNRFTTPCLTIALIAMTPLVANGQISNLGPAGMDTPIVHAGVFGLRPDGTIGGSAVDTAAAAGEEIVGTVYLSPCGGLGASSGQLPISASATDVWRLSGRVAALSDAQVSLQLTFQRLRQGRQDVSLPERTVSLVLKRGDRTRLDSVTTPAAGVCPERSAALDVAFGSRNELRGWPAGTSSGMVGANAQSAGVGDAPKTEASGRGSGGRNSGGGGGAVRVVRSGEAGTTVTQFAAAGRSPRGNVSADLWLVHDAPGAANLVREHLTVDGVRSFPRQFSFQSLTVTTTSGILTVRVDGTLETGLSPEGEPRLFVSAERTVRFALASGAARDTAPIVEGSTKTSVAMPGPSEVLSFEMPPLQVPGGQVLPDLLSIRVRLSQPAQE